MSILTLIGWLLLCVSLGACNPGWASWDSPNNPNPEGHFHNKSWDQKIEAGWGGHFKAIGSLSWLDKESIYQPVGTGICSDYATELRIKNELFFGEWGHFETHYEAVLSRGDTWKKGNELKRLYPDSSRYGFLMSRSLEDDRRLMDLTGTIEENDDFILYHRLDRFYLTLLSRRGMLRVGRQAVTWGNGFLFNPMDLFNPFSPTDIERDYKVGDDIVSMLLPLSDIGDFQFLYVPRRDPSSGDVEWNQSSLVGKLHFFKDVTEFDIMAGSHYQGAVLGLGGTGFFRDAAWRLDVTWTFPHKDSNSDDYLSMVANMDYSWIWWGKNFYGFIEIFYNGLGKNNYTEALADPDITERIDRGELFTLGRTYLGSQIRLELHPLFNVYLTVTNNLADPSGILQPWATWDMTQDFRITFGGNIFYGGRGTEYGGFKIPGTDYLNKPPDRAYIWLTYFY